MQVRKMQRYQCKKCLGFYCEVHKSKSHHGCVFLANGDVLDDSLQYALSQTPESWARCVGVCVCMRALASVFAYVYFVSLCV